MQHFFVSPEQVREEKICVEGSDVNHMKNVLRMKTGEELTIGDGDGWLYVCVVESYEEDMAVLKILEKKKDESELPSKIYLFQGLPKQDKMELIVQKAVELGVYQVIPVATKRAVVKLDAKKAKKKVERWQHIPIFLATDTPRFSRSITLILASFPANFCAICREESLEPSFTIISSQLSYVCFITDSIALSIYFSQL